MSDKRFSNNPYYSPEKCGLKVIDSIEGGLSYEFDMVVVWQDLKSKKYYWGSDSGCSCPTPFEDVHRMSDLATLNVTHFKTFEDAVHGIYYGCSSADKSKFISKWRTKLKSKKI